MGDRFFVGKPIELAVIGKRRPVWLRALTNVPETTALLAYKGKMENLGRDSDLRFVVKDSYFLAVEYDVFSEEGAMNLQIALGKYQMAVEEFRARGTLDERLIGVELGGFQEKGRINKWTFMIAHSGDTLEFIVNNKGWSNFKAKEEYTEEEAKDLQRATFVNPMLCCGDPVSRCTLRNGGSLGQREL